MMTGKKKILAASMAALLFMAVPFQTFATSIESLDQKINSDSGALSDAQDEKKQLESNLDAAQAIKEALEDTKSELTGHVIELDSQMNEVSAKVLEVQQLLDSKTEELEQTAIELEQAKKDVDEQYKNMKTRIKFMYEHGSTTYIQILLSAGSFSEMLNKAEYIEQLSAYDREMLQKFEDTKEKVTKLEEDLTVQKEVLAQTKVEVQAQQSEMAGLIKDKQAEIENYEEDIENKEEAIKEYEDMIAEQDDTIRALEASVAAAKAAKDKLSVSDNSAEGQQGDYNGGAFCWPAPSYVRISDNYGYRLHPILKVQQFHNGLDMAAPSGSPILAAYDGTIVAASYSATMGNYIMIDHGSGLYTIYMHASALYVSAGQTVTKGGQIGAVGSTGRSTGAHLHFSVRLNGSYVNPWDYL